MGRPASNSQPLIVCGFLPHLCVFLCTMTDDADTSIQEQTLSIIGRTLSAAGMTVLVVLYIRHKRDLERWNNMIPVVPEWKMSLWGPRTPFSLSDLETATNGFAKENLIGKGLNGTVYKGYLEDGSAVAVKNLTGTRQRSYSI